MNGVSQFSNRYLREGRRGLTTPAHRLLPEFSGPRSRPGEQNQQRQHLLCSAPLLHSLMSVATSSHPRPIQMWACFQRCNSNLRAHTKLTTDQDGTVCQFIKRQIPSLRHIGLQRGLLTKHLFNQSILYRAGGFAVDLKLHWHHRKHAHVWSHPIFSLFRSARRNKKAATKVIE